LTHLFDCISAESGGKEAASLAKVTMFDPTSPLPISLGIGVHNIYVVIEDIWGAKAVFHLPTPVVVDPISGAAFDTFMKSGKLDELAGSGDKGTMMMVLQAQAQVLADSEEALMTEEALVGIQSLAPSPEEEEYNKAVVKGQLKVDSLNKITDMGGAVSDMPTADILAKTVEALVGESPLEGEKGDVGLEATKAATNILQVC
jgi:hypothetical protein